jgi:hypothetical protein
MLSRGVLSSVESVSTRALNKKLGQRNVGGFLLGTDFPAPDYGTYSLEAGCAALNAVSIEDAQTTRPPEKLDVDISSSHVPQAPSQTLPKRGSGSFPKSHVNTLAFPPQELMLVKLHQFLAQEWPSAICFRWQRWRSDLPPSPCLHDFEGCSMALRFLQHFLDSQYRQR